MATQFRSESSYENASILLEACFGTLKDNGCKEEAVKVRGLEATCFNTAYASLLVLKSIRISGICASAIQDTVRALEECVFPEQRLAS